MKTQNFNASSIDARNNDNDDEIEKLDNMTQFPLCLYTGLVIISGRANAFYIVSCVIDSSNGTKTIISSPFLMPPSGKQPINSRKISQILHKIQTPNK